MIQQQGFILPLFLSAALFQVAAEYPCVTARHDSVLTRPTTTTFSTTITTVDPQICNAARNCTSAILSDVYLCSSISPSHSPCVVELGEGEFLLENVTADRFFSWSNLRNVILRGTGSHTTRLVFSNVGFFFTLLDSQHVQFEGFSVDMLRVPFTLGRVLSISETSTEIVVSDQDLYPTDEVTRSRYSFMRHAQAVDGYDPVLEQYNLPDDCTLANPIPLIYSQRNTTAAAAAAKNDLSSPTTPPVQYLISIMRSPFGAKLGQYLVVRHQAAPYNAFEMHNVSNVVLKDVVLYSAGGMGVLCTFCTNLELNGFQTRRRRFPDSGKIRAMSICKDGIHICNSMGGTVTVTNCTLEGQGDDGMNINSPFGRIAWISKDRLTISLISRTGSALGSANGYFFTGSTPEFFSGRNMSFLSFGSSIVSASEAGGVVMSQPLPSNVQLYDLVVNNDAQVESVIVENCTFKNNRARGVLLKQSNAIVQNSLFEGQSSPAILSEIDGCFWMEGRPFRNWTITGNTIVGPNTFGNPRTIIHVRGEVAEYDDATGKPTSVCRSTFLPGIFANVSITKNRIDSYGKTSQPVADPEMESSLSIYGTRGIVVQGNVVRSVLRTSRSDCEKQIPGKGGVPKPDFGIYYSDRIAVDNNTCLGSSREASGTCCVDEHN